MADQSPKDLRTSKRVHFIRDINIVGVGKRRSLDLSSGGMYLETISSFPTESLLDLHFKLSDSDPEEIHVHARVLYLHPGIGVGLSFVNLSQENKEKIQRWIDQQ